MANASTTWWIAVLCALTTACGGDDDIAAVPDAGDIVGDRPDASPDPQGSCGPDTCDGCCDGDACLTGSSPSACGGGGEACAVCEPGFVCESAACAVDRTSRWDVLADSADVFEDNTGGGTWDPAGGLPDPYVYMVTTDGIDELIGDTESPDNTLAPGWNEVVLADVPAGALLDNGLSTTLYDDDFLVDPSDSMGTWLIELTDGDFTGNAVTATCPFNGEAGARGWTLRLRLIRK